MPLRGLVYEHEFLENEFIRVGGQRFESGLYAHAVSSYKFNLGGNWKTFKSGYGIQDKMPGSVVFVVLGDGKELFRSPLIRDHTLRRLEVNVTGVKILELIVEDNGNHNYDWAVWIEPALERGALPQTPVQQSRSTRAWVNPDYAPGGRFYVSPETER